MQAPADLLRAAARGRSRVERLFRRAPVRLAFFALLALAACWVGLRHAGQMNMYRDGQVLLSYEESARKSVVEFGQLPLWNPYYCGGMYGLGSPQARFGSPTFLLTLLFGTLRAEPLIVFFMMIVGLEGMFRYARARGAGSLGAALAAPVFALSGNFAFSAALGWTNFLGFELLPWVLLGFRRAANGELRGVVMAALSLAFIVGFGGTYAAPMSVVLVAMEVVSMMTTHWKMRQNSRIVMGLGVCLAAGLLAIGASAFRLWPVAETISSAPRVIGGAPGTAIPTMLQELVLPITSGQNGDFDPPGTYYVGGFVIAALLAGIVRRRSLGLVVSGYLCAWLGAGYGLKPSLFAMLKALPVYESLRYPERFLIPMAIFVAALAAIGITRLSAISRKRPFLGLAGMCFACFALLGGTWPLVRNHQVAMTGRLMVAPPAEVHRDFHQARGIRWAAAYYPPMSRGSLSCWDAYPVPESPLLRGDLADEAYVGEPGTDTSAIGTVKTTRWTPNRIELDVDLTAPARVFVNQNAHPGWRSSVGTATSERGMLAIDMPAGKQHVVLDFLPRSALGGALASIVALAAAIVLMRMHRKTGPIRDRRALLRVLATSVAPALPIALVLLFWRESAAAHTELKTTAGEDVVVDASPPDSKKAGVVFAGGLELVAVRTSTTSPRPGSTMIIELDWRARPPTQKGMGVFMHIDATPNVPKLDDAGAPIDDKENHLNGDHPTFSGVIDPDHVPEGKIVRDIVELTVPEDAANKQWKVWMGLWMLKGRGERIKVNGTGSMIVEDDRVLVATFDVK